MSSVLKLYRASDNSLLSPQGEFANAVTFTLRADLEETDSVRLYAECDAGYQATDVVVEPEGATNDKWSLAPDVAESPGTYENWGVALSLGTVGAGAGGRVYFWARARATDDEEIGVDNSVLLSVEGIGESV